MHMTAMLDYECLNCCWVNAHILTMLDETIVKNIWGWAFKSSLCLEKLKSYGEFVIYLIIHMTAMLVFDFRLSMRVFHYNVHKPPQTDFLSPYV